MDSWDLLKFVGTILFSVGSGGGIVFLLSSWLGKVWANRILESDRARYSKELDFIRHQFKLEQQKLTVVYESQKNSFKRVIHAMHEVMEEIEGPWDGAWEPIDEKVFIKFRKIIVEESLFLDLESKRALNCFMRVIGRIEYIYGEEPPKDFEVRQAYNQLSFISKCVGEYFNQKVGLSVEGSPIFDVDLFAACFLINHTHLSAAGFPIKNKLKFEINQTPYELVSIAEENIILLKEELGRLIKHLDSEPEEKRIYFKEYMDAKQYLDIFSSSKIKQA